MFCSTRRSGLENWNGAFAASQALVSLALVLTLLGTRQAACNWPHEVQERRHAQRAFERFVAGF